MTEFLEYDIYINENKTVYISENDIKNLFDATIYYDEQYNQIITTSNTKVANIVIDEKQMIVNNSNVSMLDAIIKINDIIYLPISDMEIVYNIDIDYIEETNRVVIDELNTGMIRAIVTDYTDIKYKPRALSKNIGILTSGETVTCFYTTSKGWRQVRTSNGILGYIKANKLGDEYIVRQDIDDREEATKINRDIYNNNLFEITSDISENIVLKSIFNVSNENIEITEETDYDETYKVWSVISNSLLKSQINEMLKDYKTRTALIDLIVKTAIENEVNGISIDFTEIEDEENFARFVIECTPKLREVGITTCLVLNENMQEENYINIVDYIVE